MIVDTPVQRGIAPTVMRLRQVKLSDENFFYICQDNPQLHLERTAQGDIVFMTPAGAESSSRNLALGAHLYSWARRDNSGVAFDSSAGFVLPSGAIRSPDAAWVRRERLAALSREQKQRFLPLCPDFVVELRSPTDRVEDLQAKMEEYIANGAQLGWLLVPESRDVYLYQPNAPMAHLSNPETLSGEPLLPGFTLTLAEIWDVGF